MRKLFTHQTQFGASMIHCINGRNVCAACVCVFMEAHVICLQHLTYAHQTSYWYDILYALPALLPAPKCTEIIYRRIDVNIDAWWYAKFVMDCVRV